MLLVVLIFNEVHLDEWLRRYMRRPALHDKWTRKTPSKLRHGGRRSFPTCIATMSATIRCQKDRQEEEIQPWTQHSRNEDSIHEESRERKKQIGTRRRLPAAAIPSSTPGNIAKSAQSDVSPLHYPRSTKKGQLILLHHKPSPPAKEKEVC